MLPGWVRIGERESVDASKTFFYLECLMEPDAMLSGFCNEDECGLGIFLVHEF